MRNSDRMVSIGDRRQFNEEFETEFRVGQDEALLTADDRARQQQWLARIEDASRKHAGPPIAEAFQDRLRGHPTELKLGGNEADRRRSSHGLSPQEVAEFARHGVIPPRRVESLTERDLSEIERVADMVSQAGCSTGVAFLFNRQLLELATNPEIVARVASLLGDDVACVGTSGPMYLAPGEERWTWWHQASGTDFGVSPDGTLTQVSCWLALSDVTRENGCMKMVPGSFAFGGASEEFLPQLPAEAASDLDAFVAWLESIPYTLDMSVVSKILCRRLNLHRVGSLQRPGPDGMVYHPFQLLADMTMLLGGRAALEGMRTDEVRALEAEAGDLYVFTSLNWHGSLKNESTRWRKAIAIRYVSSANATTAASERPNQEMERYFQVFPRAGELSSKLGWDISAFRRATPRIRVSGKVPAGEEYCFVDVDGLRRELERDDTYLDPRARD